jgi:hypothetical protein
LDGLAYSALSRGIMAQSSADRLADAALAGQDSRLVVPPSNAATEIYFRQSACDASLLAFRDLGVRPEDPFVLAKAVPGVVYTVRDSY